MNKMKKAAAALSMHLGADTRGKNLLDALLREVNATRKELASVQAALEKKDETTDVLKSQISKLSAENNRLNQELHTSNQTISKQSSELLNKQHEIDTLERILDPPIKIPLENKLTNKTRFKSLFKSLRKEIPRPPKPTSVCSTHGISDRAYIFNLSDFVSGYNTQQYLNLGMFVVLCGVLRWPVGFINNTPCVLEFDLKDWDGGEYGRFLRWMKENWIQKDPAWKDEIVTKCFNLSPDSITPQVVSPFSRGML
jgi:hypothetical protein